MDRAGHKREFNNLNEDTNDGDEEDHEVISINCKREQTRKSLMKSKKIKADKAEDELEMRRRMLFREQ